MFNRLNLLATALIVITVLILPLAASARITTEIDIAYLPSGDEKHTLDLYLPGTPTGKTPVLIFIHGGAWRTGDKKRFNNHGVFYARRGIAFVSVNYRLTPPVQHPDHVEDCAAAVAWVFRNVAKYGFDKNKIYLSGHSAGAHLAALLATNRRYLEKEGGHPTGFAGVIPVDTASYDLTDVGGRLFEKRLLKKTIRKAFGSDLHVLKEASPLLHVKNKRGTYPPFLILVSGKRSHAVKQSQALEKALIAKGCSATIMVFEQHNHKNMAKKMIAAEDPLAKAILGFVK